MIEKNQVQLLLVNELLECLIMEIMKLKEKHLKTTFQIWKIHKFKNVIQIVYKQQKAFEQTLSFFFCSPSHSMHSLTFLFDEQLFRKYYTDTTQICYQIRTK